MEWYRLQLPEERQLQPVADKGEWRGDYLKGEQQHEGGFSRS